MDGYQNNQGSQPATPPQNLPVEPKFGENQNFGAPPPGEVKVRTAESDLQSIQRGDVAPTPESVFAPNESGGSEFRPETQIGGDVPPLGDDAESTSHTKKIWLWIGAGAAVIVVGIIGYLVFPKYGRNDTPPVPNVPPPPITQIVPHQSLFVAPGPSQSQIQLSNLLHLTILNALQTKALGALPAGTIEELAIQDSSGSQVPFKSFLTAFVPGFTADQAAVWFEDDFTAFFYYDVNGVWPGYIARLKPGVNSDDARLAIRAIEAEDLSKFYLVAPGGFDVFKDGALNGVATRYAVGSAPSAAFNYLFSQNYFIMSTSYDGLKTASPLLGL